MRRTITTFILLFVVLITTYLITSYKKDIKNEVSNININKELLMEYNAIKPDIEKYRVGIPLSLYNNPNSPHSNSYCKHPMPFVPGYPKSIDGIEPDSYPYMVEPNVMFVPEDHIDNDCYADLLN
jgi:hypothetical protein